MIDDDWLNELTWDAQGLIPAIAQEAATGDVLMLAWMNLRTLNINVKKFGAI